MHAPGATIGRRREICVVEAAAVLRIGLHRVTSLPPQTKVFRLKIACRFRKPERIQNVVKAIRPIKQIRLCSLLIVGSGRRFGQVERKSKVAVADSERGGIRLVIVIAIQMRVHVVADEFSRHLPRPPIKVLVVRGENRVVGKRHGAKQHVLSFDGGRFVVRVGIVRARTFACKHKSARLAFITGQVAAIEQRAALGINDRQISIGRIRRPDFHFPSQGQLVGGEWKVHEPGIRGACQFSNWREGLLLCRTGGFDRCLRCLELEADRIRRRFQCRVRSQTRTRKLCHSRRLRNQFAVRGKDFARAIEMHGHAPPEHLNPVDLLLQGQMRHAVVRGAIPLRNLQRVYVCAIQLKNTLG